MGWYISGGDVIRCGCGCGRWKLLQTSIAMVLEQLAVTLEIPESLLYFITLAIFPMCSFDCCFRWILSSWSFPHAWSDRLLKMGGGKNRMETFNSICMLIMI
jgi:hypothetical protein